MLARLTCDACVSQSPALTGQILLPDILIVLLPRYQTVLTVQSHHDIGPGLRIYEYCVLKTGCRTGAKLRHRHSVDLG